jgi:Lon protease-like protein
MQAKGDFPLFELGLVALPTEHVPLHIFEPRYRAMIGECLEARTEFGIIWDEADAERPIGCAMEIVELLERDESGRMNILCSGTRPFRILRETLSDPYPAGDVAFLSDEDELPDHELARDAQALFGDLLARATDDDGDPAELASLTAYEMAARIEFGAAAKHGLLSLRSENARLRLVAQLLRTLLKRLDFAEIALDRSRSNGKVRFG